jgi:flagellar hook-length control protein FliK
VREIAGFAALPVPIPSAAGAPGPGSNSTNGAAFAALFASFGYPSLQTPAPQAILPAASISRPAGAHGNVVPLRPLNMNGVIAGELFGDGPLVAAFAERTAVESHIAQQFADLADNTAGESLAEDFSDAEFALSNRFELPPQRTGSMQEFSPGRFLQIAQPGDDLLSAVAHARNAASPLEGAALGSVSSAAPHASAPVAAIDANAPLPLNHARFSETFSHQVTVMARDGVQHARISINPPELGPVELRIMVRHDEATVQLAASHASVREVLEEALPRLREQFEQAGMRLHDSAVFQQLPRESSGEHQRYGHTADTAADELLTQLEILHEFPDSRHQGLIDAYI